MPLCGNIPQSAFASCTNLYSVDIPRAYRIDSGAFKWCSNLSIVNNDTSPSCAIENDAFFGCGNLKNINFNNISTIGARAFRDCISLDKINLKICSSIGEYAFSSCTGITQISLSKCSQIGSSAFANCTNLSKIYIYNPASDQYCTLNNEYAFCVHDESSNCIINSNITFYFEPGVIEWYKTAEYWSHYSKYMI